MKRTRMIFNKKKDYFQNINFDNFNHYLVWYMYVSQALSWTGITLNTLTEYISCYIPGFASFPGKSIERVKK